MKNLPIMGLLKADARRTQTRWIPRMMQEPQITFRNIKPVGDVETKIREHVDRLRDLTRRLQGCRVVVAIPHRHHRDGNSYEVRIELDVPGMRISVTSDSGRHGDHRDLDVAIHGAFDEARRQLEDYIRIRRGAVKAREPQPHARVFRLLPEKGYGFLKTPDGRELYFHGNAVANGEFLNLEVGSEVSFTETLGVDGPQATTVHKVGRHSRL